MNVVRRQLACERARVGQQRDAAAREGGAGEVAREAGDRLAQLRVAARHRRRRHGDAEPRHELREAPLVVQARERREGGGVEAGDGAQALAPRREVEDVLPARDDHVDRVLVCDALDVRAEGGGVEARRRGDKVAAHVA
jgi:hypothetical protein